VQLAFFRLYLVLHICIQICSFNVGEKKLETKLGLKQITEIGERSGATATHKKFQSPMLHLSEAPTLVPRPPLRSTLNHTEGGANSNVFEIEATKFRP